MAMKVIVVRAMTTGRDTRMERKLPGLVVAVVDEDFIVLEGQERDEGVEGRRTKERERERGTWGEQEQEERK